MAISSEKLQQRRSLFTTEAAAYATGRPGYPAAVQQLLSSTCGLGDTSNVLEIGPGTGQATADLLRSGAQVTAIELGADLASHLRTTLRSPRLRVIEGAFEKVTEDRGIVPSASFDLIVSATAFHWVPAAVAVPRCAELLRPGGWLALWWNVFGDPGRPDPLHEALLPILQRWAPQLVDDGLGSPHALDVDERVADIDVTEAFGPVTHELIEWMGHHTADETRALFATFSPWLALEEPLRTEMLDRVHQLAATEFDDQVIRHYLTPVYLARRKG